MQCFTDIEGEYYLGCVGTFGEDGSFDDNSNQSVYYTETKNNKEPLTLLDYLLEYINKK